MTYDFTGWATRNNLRCSDGRTIMKDAFKDNDGMTVPLVWNHRHDEPGDVLGHALLKNANDGVRVYGTFNDTESGVIGKALVQHGDITSLSIYANQLRQDGGKVLHGNIREVSLVHAGANPGAYIDEVMYHGDESEDGESAVIYTGFNLELAHANDDADDEDHIEHADKADTTETVEDVFNTLTEKQKTAVYAIIGSMIDENEIEHADKKENDDDDEDMTVEEVFNTLSEKQKTAVYAIIGSLLENTEGKEVKHSDEEGDDFMKRNVFESNDTNELYLTHADQEEIVRQAKNNGSFQATLKDYISNGMPEEELQHGFDGITQLFPDYKDVRPGAPELITRDQSWVSTVMNGVRKSPISRIRTRQMDIRDIRLRAEGYKTKGEQKIAMQDATLVSRTTDPQTIYVKDSLHRDDIIDITDFDIVAYEYEVMRTLLNEEIARAILIGDGRLATAADKIQESHIRPIWTDEELYTIHGDVDFATAEAELQGDDTDKHFGENYIYAEAIITQSLYLRERYKGSGKPDFFCTPHLLNIMLLARDLNGRRIYDSETDLARALNVNSIHTVEQFEDQTRSVTVTVDNVDTIKTKKLLGIFVNLADYQVGSTKGGEVTKFSDFDIDFNKEKYLLETRLSGALTRIYSAIVLEEDVTA